MNNAIAITRDEVRSVVAEHPEWIQYANEGGEGFTEKDVVDYYFRWLAHAVYDVLLPDLNEWARGPYAMRSMALDDVCMVGLCDMHDCYNKRLPGDLFCKQHREWEDAHLAAEHQPPDPHP